MMEAINGSAIAWKPLPAQEKALKCPAREVAYAGEKGAGKTEWLAACWFELLALAHKKWQATGRPQHRCRIAIFRKNMSHLEDLINKTKILYPLFDPVMGIKGWNVNKSRWTFTSGATVEFHHLDGPNDHLGFHGQELIGIGFDQVEQIEQAVYVFIVANNRSGDADYHTARRIRCTANPGGYDWIIPYFGIDKFPDGNRILREAIETSDGKTYETTRAFIRARLRENSHLPADYEAQLRSIYNEDEVAMFLEGDFFRIAGSYFSKLLRPGTHFVKSHPVPSTWEFRFAMDWGSTNPAAWYLGARDNDGRLWVIDELHKPGITGRKFGEDLTKKYRTQKWCADKIFKVEDFYGVIDKQAMDKYGSDACATEGIAEWGFRLFAAQKDRETGCNAMKERLLPDRFGQPQLVIFEDRCPHLVRALSAIQSQAPRKPDDYADDSPLSHAVDGFRFLVMEFPVESQRGFLTPEDKQTKMWEDYLRRARARQEPTREQASHIGGGYE